MTITELIAALEEMREEHGDLKVVIPALGLGGVREPRPHPVEPPVCGDGCCHGHEVWL